MFISENASVQESAELFYFIRTALMEQIAENNENSEILSYLESASDAEILAYATTGKAAPKDIDPFIFETAVLSQLKDVVLEEGENLFIKELDYSAIDFIQEIGSMQGITSKDIIQEGKVKDFAIKAAHAGDKIDKSIVDKIGNKTISKGYDKLHNWQMHNRKKIGLTDTKDNVKLAVHDAKESVASAAGKAVEKGKDLYDDAKGSVVRGSHRLMNNIRQLGDKAADGWSKVAEYTKNNPGKAIGGAALVGIASFIAYKAYQRYLSKAARVCAGKSGAEKTACMAKAKQTASKARAASLRKGMSLASKSANPSQVRSALSKKIAALSS